MNHKASYQPELCKLLEIVSNMALAIRVRSAYSGGGDRQTTPDEQWDLMWLSDAMHNLNTLASAILNEDEDAVLASARRHLWMCVEYQTTERCKASFARFEQEGIYLNQYKEVFSRIKAIAGEQIESARPGIELSDHPGLTVSVAQFDVVDALKRVDNGDAH